jgi:hypothetical protein
MGLPDNGDTGYMIRNQKRMSWLLAIVAVLPVYLDYSRDILAGDTRHYSASNKGVCLIHDTTSRGVVRLMLPDTSCDKRCTVLRVLKGQKYHSKE